METSLTADVVSIFSILAGISIVAFWTNLHFRSELFDPSSSRSPVETKYHVVAELITAIFLVVGGASMLLALPRSIPISFAGLGMLLYANVNGMGYYIRINDRSMVRVFLVIIALTAIALAALLAAA